MEGVEKFFMTEEEFSETYEFGNAIGQGSFGTVFEGINKLRSTDKLAIKSIPVAPYGDEYNKLMEEVAIMLQLNHVNIVKLYNYSKGTATNTDPFGKYYSLKLLSKLTQYLLNIYFNQCIEHFVAVE